MSDQETPKPAPPDSLEVMKYKEELASKMGLPSPYGMNLMKEIAGQLVQSGFVPAHFQKNPMAVFLAVMRGREMDLAPMESVLETFWSAPGGRLGMYANKMLAILQRNGITSKFIHEGDDYCEILFTPPAPHIPYTAKFSREEAKNAGLIKTDSNWEKWKSDMNKARAIARGWRSLSGTFKGGSNMYIPEELEDLPGENDTSRPATEEDKARAEKVANDYRASVRVVDVTPTQEAEKKEEPKPAVATLYRIVQVADNGSHVPTNETPQPDLPVTQLRAQALANENKKVYLVLAPDNTVAGKANPPTPIRKDEAAPAEASAAAPAASTKKKHGPAESAMVQRIEAAIRILDPSPKAVKATWLTRINAFVAAYLGCKIKDLPKDLSLWEEAMVNLESLLADDPEVFRVGPERAGESRRKQHQELVEYAAKMWSNSPSVQALAVNLATKWSLDPAHFAKFIEGNGYDFISSSEDLHALFTVYTKTREAGRIAKLVAKHKEPSIKELVTLMEQRQLGGKRIEAADPKDIDKAIATWESELAKASSPVTRPQEPTPEAEQSSPLDDLFSSIV